MKLAIMQPYFFPYLGYFDLINRVDQWVAFDTVKYSPRSWMNRNRILHPTEGWQYITVPVNKHVGNGLICDVALLDLPRAKEKVIAQVQHYRKGRAPYFRTVAALIEEVFTSPGVQSLSDLNIRSLKVICSYLDIKMEFQMLSKMGLVLPEIDHPGQWALEISDKLGASEYINPPGGRGIFRPEDWSARNIKLIFTELIDFKYNTEPYGFVDHLSILDVVMWNPADLIKEYLDSRRSVGALPS